MTGITRTLASAAVALTAGLAAAQQAAPPSFAPPNLTASGIRSLAANCAACHGTNGRPAPNSVLPGLAGKPSGELLTAMTQFKDGRKPASLMHQLSKGYSDEELQALADHFSKQSR